jgi:hypothetical protein
VWNDDERYLPANLADLKSNDYFTTRVAPHHWVCWDFRSMRVHPTHYTIKTQWLKSCVIVGSVDGSTWWEIDRRMDTEDFKVAGINLASLAASNSVECRFIRLTQPTKSQEAASSDMLALWAVEFCGTLSE